MESGYTRRRSFRLHGGDGTFDVEIVRLEQAALEVRRTDVHGKPLDGAVIVHSWQEAREKVAELVADAVRTGVV